MRLQNRVAIITGGCRGIGEAIALRFLKEGAFVVIADRILSTDPAHTPAEESLTRTALLAIDISDLSSHQMLARFTLERFGRIDILVNNAGIQIREPLRQADPASWDRVIGTNLKGPYFLTQRIAREMNASGSVINLSSVHDQRPASGNSIYSITKAGVQMMTRCQALELAESGIRVNAIAPGAVSTDINRDVLSNEDHRIRVEQKIPLRRIGVPDDIAGAAVFLASSESAYITGSTIYVDGGLTLQ